MSHDHGVFRIIISVGGPNSDSESFRDEEIDFVEGYEGDLSEVEEMLQYCECQWWVNHFIFRDSNTQVITVYIYLSLCEKQL